MCVDAVRRGWAHGPDAADGVRGNWVLGLGLFVEVPDERTFGAGRGGVLAEQRTNVMAADGELLAACRGVRRAQRSEQQKEACELGSARTHRISILAEAGGWSRSICAGAFGAVDDEGVDGAACGDELEAELLLEGCK